MLKGFLWVRHGPGHPVAGSTHGAQVGWGGKPYPEHSHETSVYTCKHNVTIDVLRCYVTIGVCVRVSSVGRTWDQNLPRRSSALHGVGLPSRAGVGRRPFLYPRVQSHPMALTMGVGCGRSPRPCLMVKSHPCQMGQAIWPTTQDTPLTRSPPKTGRSNPPVRKSPASNKNSSPDHPKVSHSPSSSPPHSPQNSGRSSPESRSPTDP